MEGIKSPRNIILAIITVVVVAGVGFALINSEWPQKPPYTYTAAPQGEAVSGFPPELILDDKAKLANSYSLNYSANLKQYTAIYDSDQSMPGLFAVYKDYLQKNGWTITNEIVKYPTSRGIYATKGTTEASIAIAEQGKTTQVIVSYVTK